MDAIVKAFTCKDIENVFTQLYVGEKNPFWLDSSRLTKETGRFSFMGKNPLFVVTINQGKCMVKGVTHNEILEGDPFILLQQLLDQYALSSQKFPHLPFVGGFVGYFGYEMAKYNEKVPTHFNDPVGADEGCWMFYDQILIFDHMEERTYISQLIDKENNREVAEKELNVTIQEIQKASCLNLRKPSVDLSSIEKQYHLVESVSSYLAKIRKIKQYISYGEIYQACFTHPFSTDVHSDPYDLYQVLRRLNPAPFSCFLKQKGSVILSSSPERFLRKDLTGVLESRPIKGTRPRNKDPLLDEQLNLELLHSEKDRAENVMIVDLVRNDLSRVCDRVYVPSLLKVESYETVHQLVSTVRGVLNCKIRPMEAIKALFPGGSMTGAPKISAMKILYKLENVARGIYSGGLGYLDVRGSFDLSMVIRTLIYANKKVFFHVGGGIVMDSDPMEEYKESLDKAYALKKAIACSESKINHSPTV